MKKFDYTFLIFVVLLLFMIMVSYAIIHKREANTTARSGQIYSLAVK